MNIIQRPSPNFNLDRVILPVAIVIHWTAGSFESAVNWLCNPSAQVSAHFVINETGEQVYQLVDMNRRAWHCNPSWHPAFMGQQINGLNSYSIGIECEGSPSYLRWGHTWTKGFLESLINLCKYIKEKVPTVTMVTDHSTISPQLGKSDVLGGKGIDSFPWVELLSGCELKDGSTSEMRSQIRVHYGMTP